MRSPSRVRTQPLLKLMVGPFVGDVQNSGPLAALPLTVRCGHDPAVLM